MKLHPSHDKMKFLPISQKFGAKYSSLYSDYDYETLGDIYRAVSIQIFEDYCSTICRLYLVHNFFCSRNWNHFEIFFQNIYQLKRYRLSSTYSFGNTLAINVEIFCST